MERIGFPFLFLPLEKSERKAEETKIQTKRKQRLKEGKEETEKEESSVFLLPADWMQKMEELLLPWRLYTSHQ
jgi:hypothetical protein